MARVQAVAPAVSYMRQTATAACQATLPECGSESGESRSWHPEFILEPAKRGKARAAIHAPLRIERCD